MPTGYAATGAADARLYLRESELDQGARALRNAWKGLRRLAHEAVPAEGLSPPEIDILIELLGLVEADVKTLRNLLESPKQTFARHIQSLEKRNLIRRRTCPTDRRRRLIGLTDEGSQLALHAAGAWRTALSSAFMAAGSEDVAGTRRLLALLAEAAPVTKYGAGEEE